MNLWWLFCRVYDNDSLRQVWQVGPLPMGKKSNPNSSILYVLGESVVAFDIAPAINIADASYNLNTSAMDLTRKSLVSRESLQTTSTGAASAQVNFSTFY